MRHIDAEQVNRVLDFPALVEALQRGHARPVDVLRDVLLELPGESARPDIFFTRAAWQGGEAVGIKLITLFPANVEKEKGLPSIQALYVLFDGRDGQPLATLDGTALTYWKTAADSALGSKLLARPDARRMVMVGAGAMAGPLIRAHCAVRPSLAEVKIWNRTAARAEELADLLSGEGIAATAAEDLEAAVREADLVCCATMSKTPVIQGDWLRPGTHLDLVGAFNPEMREADDAAIRRARVFVDSRATTLEDVGEIAIPLASGVLKEADILGDLFDLCGKSPPTGRQSAQDITFFKNGGGGHLDLMTARHVVACLERTGTTAESD